ELLKLGFDLSEPTVSRWVRRAPRPPDPARRWLIFLRNHREAIAAMDFFTVPTLTFGILYCFFVIGHDRRRILHCNVTRNPNALWVALQLNEAGECGEQPQRFLIFDRDAKFSADVVSTVKAMGSHPIRTAFRSPWQNGIADLKDIKCLVDSGALRRSKPGRQGRQAGSGCRPRDRATGEKGQRGTCSWREVAVDVENHAGSVAR